MSSVTLDISPPLSSDVVEVLAPPSGCVPGEHVFVEGYEEEGN